MIDDRGVGEQVEDAEVGRQLQGDLALDELLAPPPVLDQVGDGAHLEAVLAAEAAQVGDAGHRAVLVQDFADDGDFAQPGEPAQIDAALGVPGPDQDAAGPRDQAVHVPLVANEVLRAAGGIDADLDGPARSWAEMPVLTPVRASKLWVKGVAVGSRLTPGSSSRPRRAACGLREGDAQPAAGLADHEVDRRGRDELRRHDEVALVFAVLVVDQHDHAASAKFVERFVGRAKAGVVAHVDPPAEKGSQRSIVLECESSEPRVLDRAMVRPLTAG